MNVLDVDGPGDYRVVSVNGSSPSRDMGILWAAEPTDDGRHVRRVYRSYLYDISRLPAPVEVLKVLWWLFSKEHQPGPETVYWGEIVPESEMAYAAEKLGV